MKIEQELFAHVIGEQVAQYIRQQSLEKDAEIQSTAVQVLSELQVLFLQDDIVSDDFLLVENMIDVFHRYGLDTGCCHDF